MNPNEFDEHIYLVLIKIFAIFYVAVLFTIFGIYITTLLDEYGFNDFFINNNNSINDSVFKLIYETAIIVAVIAVFAFLGRNIVQLIPFPFNGVYGFKYDSVKEVGSGSILLVFMFTFSASLFNKIEILRKKLDLVKKNNHFNSDMKDIIA
jgi:hypothetical protein